MVVVAIVGILATIASSEFGTLIARTRQAEAKSALGAMFTAQKIFHSEHGSYTICLKQAGYYADIQTKRYYMTGTWNGPTSKCGPDGASACHAYTWNPTALCESTCPSFPLGLNDTTYPATIKVSSTALLLNDCGNGTTAGVPYSWDVGKDWFLMGAAGNIVNENRYDMWTIDHNQQLVNTVHGY